MYRHIDIRIVSCLQSPECKPGDAAYDIAIKIAKSMTRKYIPIATLLLNFALNIIIIILLCIQTIWSSYRTTLHASCWR